MIYLFYHVKVFEDLVTGLSAALTKQGISSEIINKIPKHTKQTDLYICYGFNNYDGHIPTKYIVYQLEQTSRTLSRHWFHNKYQQLLQNAIEVWDYSITNIQNLKTMGITTPISYVPLNYMHVLDVIPRLPEDKRSIDVLFYGSENPRRVKIYNDLMQIGLKVDFNWYNLWSEDLRAKISQAKIVINIHYYDSPILETSRLSYLVGNGAFVISEPSSDPILDRNWQDLVVFSPYDHLVENCIQYLVKKEDRVSFQSTAYQKFQQRPYKVPNTALLPYHEEIKPIQVEQKGLPEVELHYLEAESEMNDEGHQILKLPEISFSQLPEISIITLTYNRSEILDIAVRNFQRFIYPEDKIEWVVVDDSNERNQLINQRKIGMDPRIKYISLDKKTSISEKRNYGVNEARYDILVHMDDDDYYPPESLLARVKLLLKYSDQGIGCVGCTKLGVYNLCENYSYLLDCKFPSEASLAYTRKFWEANPFPEKDVPEGEGIPFLYKRTSEVVLMPYIFNLIAITHHKNITGKLRTLELDSEVKYSNFFDMWDFNTQLFFLEMKSNIKKLK